MAGNSKEARKITDLAVQLLVEERQRLGYSQRKLATLSGISQSGLNFIERGERRPTMEIVLQIADALEIELWPVLQKAERTLRK